MAKKPGLNQEVLDKFCQILLNKSVEEMLGVVFTKETLKTNQALSKFEESNFAEELRKYVKVNDLRLLSKKHDGERTIDNLISMFRYCVNKQGFELKTSFSEKKVDGKRVITKEIIITKDCK